MKKSNKIILVLLGMLLFANISCETTDLDLTTDPNALPENQADPNFLLNNIQIQFAGVVENFGRSGAEITRIDNMFGRDYQNAYSPSSFDGEWEDAYTEMFTDIEVMNVLAEEGNLTYHLGMGQFMKAYTLVLLVDMFGDVPFSEANQGANNLTPSPDAGADVYAGAFDLLDEAISNFNSAPSSTPQYDFFYKNNNTNWIKACNTLKMKMWMQLRLVDPTALPAFNAIASNPANYISSVSEDLQFQYGTNEVQPDVRHPRYTASYTTTGGGDYMSNWLMNYMDTNNDPRIRYYYYRQNSATPGAEAPPDEETLDCSLQEAPPHYEGFPFCALENGYWGRDHGNDAGTPPDGFLRTLVGVYPAAGKFDDNTFAGQSQGDGGGGAGITPILLSSTADFLLAEAALVNNDAPAAKTAILSGLSKSVNKVRTFGVTDPTADLSFEPTAGDIADHANAIALAYDAAGSNEDRWNIMAEEFFVSLYGNGIDAFNFYRRTGYPTTLQPNIEPDPGSVVRSFFYPANEANTNSNIVQKDNHLVQVFWDNNSASPTFPAAN